MLLIEIFRDSNYKTVFPSSSVVIIATLYASLLLLNVIILKKKAKFRFRFRSDNPATKQEILPVIINVS